MAQDGSILNPWQVSTPEDLQNVGHADDLNNDWSDGLDETETLTSKYDSWSMNDHYILMNDIDWNDHTNTNFKPIGLGLSDGPSIFKGVEFEGHFNGDNYEIKNIQIDIPLNNTDPENVEGYHIGLFAYNSGTITSVGLVDGTVTGAQFVGSLVGRNEGSITSSYNTGTVDGSDYVGGLVGYNEGTITNSYNSGTVTGVGVYVGGLVGGNVAGGSITNSYNIGSVDGVGAVGGLVGFNWGGSITNSYNSGTVTGNDYVGGLVGYNGGSITNSYNTGIVTGGSAVGGLVGINDGSITNSYNTGAVTGQMFVGGLAGFNDGIGSITNSYNTGTVDGSEHVGGLAGLSWNGSITSSYNTGIVTGDTNVGGLVGFNDGEGSITNSYNTGTVDGSGSEYVGGLVGNNDGGSITSSYNTGTVDGSNYVGGLAGFNLDGSITNSYNTGIVTGFSMYVGGLVGLSIGSITSSYNTGTVTEGGGLVGDNFGSITNSYYDSETSGQSDTGNGEPRTTAQMQNILTYTDEDYPDIGEGPNEAWDIINVQNEYRGNHAFIWNTEEDNYPSLSWQYINYPWWAMDPQTKTASGIVDDTLGIQEDGKYGVRAVAEFSKEGRIYKQYSNLIIIDVTT